MDIASALAGKPAQEQHQSRSRVWLGLALSLLLSACGGGGGGNATAESTASASSSSLPTSEVPETTQNNPAETTGTPTEATPTEATPTEAIPTEATPTDPETPTPPAPVQLTPFILPFDSIDSSVVLRSSLTSATAIQDAGGIEEPTSDNRFDSTLGMQPSAPVGGVPGARFSVSTIPGLANLPSGQLSIEVERAWLAVTDPEVRSSGYVHASNEYLLSYGTGEIQTVGKLYVQADQKLLWMINPPEGSRTSSYVNTTQSSRFARLTISWTPTSAELYVDGLLMGSLPRTDPGPDRFSNIYLGNQLGGTSYPFLGDYYVRNLIVASKPVTINTVQPLLGHVMHIGDSFAGGQPFFNVANKYDGTIVNTVIKTLIGRGAGFDSYSVFSNGGGQIQDNGTDPLELDSGNLSRAEVLALNPSLIVFITGGNDTSIFDSTQFTTDLHDHIEAFLGVNGHAATTTQHVIVTTTASNLNANHPATLGMTQIMRELPAWWDATYPTRVGAVSVIDTWTLFGGANVDTTLFGIADPVHPAASGNILYGNAIANEIIRLVRNRCGFSKLPRPICGQAAQ